MTYLPAFEAPELLADAAAALERQRARSGESVEEWAKALAPIFFADLEEEDPPS